mmetsp:Transcript_7562/g.23517  ORF Transcript_7562/g.23517 Transcript_7562/m.23517 type:complete len:105 (-) Transcript_7562:352-666(-)|eukprot:scaffold232316_cov39-Tisochrysis_lutea.AAC.2
MHGHNNKSRQVVERTCNATSPGTTVVWKDVTVSPAIIRNHALGEAHSFPQVANPTPIPHITQPSKSMSVRDATSNLHERIIATQPIGTVPGEQALRPPPCEVVI